MEEQYVWIKELSTECIYYAQIVSTDFYDEGITRVYCNFVIGNWKYFNFIGTLDKLKEEPCLCLLGPSTSCDHFGEACFDFNKLNICRSFL